MKQRGIIKSSTKQLTDRNTLSTITGRQMGALKISRFAHFY